MSKTVSARTEYQRDRDLYPALRLPAWDDAAGNTVRQLYELAETHPRDDQAVIDGRFIAHIKDASFAGFDAPLKFIQTTVQGAPAYQLAVTCRMLGRRRYVTVDLVLYAPATSHPATHRSDHDDNPA